MFFIEHLQREPTCRAYIQVAVITHRNKEYIADDTMACLECNCGIKGFLVGFDLIVQRLYGLLHGCETSGYQTGQIPVYEKSYCLSEVCPALYSLGSIFGKGYSSFCSRSAVILSSFLFILTASL